MTRLLEITLPNGGFALPMFEAYFDESGTHDGSPVLCVGGIIIESTAAKELDRLWVEMLGRYGIEAFHMTDCASGLDEFKPLWKTKCIDIATEAIGLARDYITDGLMVSVVPTDFERYAAPHPLVGTAYTCCAYGCIAGVQRWADRAGFFGDIAYFFESGHRSQRQANELMNEIFSEPLLRRQYRYASHTFADKKKARILQIADIVAWHWFTESKRKIEGVRPNMRADTQALMSPYENKAFTFYAMHHTVDSIKTVSHSAYKDLYPRTYPGILHEK